MFAHAADFHTLGALADALAQGFLRIELGAQLVEVGHAEVAAPANVPAVRWQFAEQQFQQGGFADAVGTDQTDFLAPFDDVAEMANQRRRLPGLEADVLGHQHQPAAAFAAVQAQLGLALLFQPCCPFPP